MARIALMGATGEVGRRILAEAVIRGHHVTAIARGISRLSLHPGVRAIRSDVLDHAKIVEVIAGHEVVVSATNFVHIPPNNLVSLARDARVARLMVVGGAGSLFASPGVQRYDQDDFPAEVRPQSKAGGVLLETLRRASDLNWTFLSPSDEIVGGQRTGLYRLGLDDMLFDRTGRSWITYEDYAVAFLDELERPRHENRRFTVGY